MLRNLGRARGESIDVTPYRLERAVALRDRALKRGSETDDYARWPRADRFAQDLECVADAFEPARVHDRLIGKRSESDA